MKELLYDDSYIIHQYIKIPNNIAARYNVQGNKIGKGSYGTVYSGIDTVTGEMYIYCNIFKSCNQAL